jgi:predicted nucleic acid-binding protein
MPVWDTSVASGLHPESPLFEVAAEAALGGEPVLLAAATVAEISFGLRRKADDPRFTDALSWFTNLLRAGLLEVVPITREEALLTGRLRAANPVPPSGAKGRKDARSKPERRVAWINDIQIAASAWLRAEPVCTADQNHFRLLAAAIAEQFPAEGPLEVLSPPV